jgi:hypothetical protein
MQIASPEPVWKVALPGYTWQQVNKREGVYQGVEPGEWVLRSPSPEGRPPDTRIIKLLELDRDLFRAFGRLGRTRDGIKQFADQYGLLGIRIKQKQRHQRQGRTQKTEKHVAHEPERLWVQQVEHMSLVILLWEACQGDDRDALHRYIRWATDGHRVALDPLQGSAHKTAAAPPPLSITLGGPDAGALPQGSLTPGDVVLPAAHFVRELVGRQLLEGTKDTPYLQRGVHPWFVWEQESYEGSDLLRVSLSPQPETLHQALWLQAATWITEGKPFKRCQGCQRWFSVPPKAPRSRVGFCSDACRVRAYRGRQDRARQMAAAGKPFAAIARELGSDVKAVRRWVTGLKEE